MNTFQIVSIYPSDKFEGKGTFHAIWIEKELHIKGCSYTTSKKGKLMAFMPSYHGIDKEGKPCRYPAISMVDFSLSKEVNKALNCAFLNYMKKITEPPKEEIIPVASSKERKKIDFSNMKDLKDFKKERRSQDSQKGKTNCS